jgi:hypothetical protein
MVIRGHFSDPAFHIFIRNRRKRHEFLTFFFPIILPTMGFLRKRRVVKLFQVPPEVLVELLQTEIGHFLHVMEETLLQNTHGIFYGALESGFSRKRQPHRRIDSCEIIVVERFATFCYYYLRGTGYDICKIKASGKATGMGFCNSRL